jgi:hypothetical protein
MGNFAYSLVEEEPNYLDEHDEYNEATKKDP